MEGEYKLRGLSFPLESGLNSIINVRNYFEGKHSLNLLQEAALRKYYPEFYREFKKNIERKTSENN